MLRTAVVLALVASACRAQPDPVQPVPTPDPPDPAPSVHTETFTAPGVADYLLVIDPKRRQVSGPDLAARIAPLPAVLRDAGLDFHIGAVFMDASDPDAFGLLHPGNGLAFVSSSTEPAVADAALAEMVAPWDFLFDTADTGDFGDVQRQGRAAAISMFERSSEPANAGFLRDGATLQLVFVSEEDDRSGSEPISRTGFLAWMDGYSGPGATAHALAEVSPACPGISFSYEQYATRSRGATGCIEQGSWLSFFEALAARSSPRFFALADTPPDEVSADVRVLRPAGADTVTLVLSTCREPTNGCQALVAAQRVQLVDFDLQPGDEVVVSWPEPAAP
ncbi:MAG: hypothetical protein H6737_13730 [Alphaproteobacteria bacterium]|nr:hypothetical protein [Alphaproteobacteria bacterium]